MPLPLPNLDDQTYADLVERARAQISSEYPDWTDHNPTDTGMVVIELVAWLTELLLYRIDQIPDRHVEMFLKLLNGSTWSLGENTTLQAETQRTVLALRQRYRAVSAEDFEQLALEDWHSSDVAKSLGQAGAITRAKCLPNRNLADPDATRRSAPTPGNISLIVVPKIAQVSPPKATPELRVALWQWLDQRRLLTTRHHIVDPEYVPVWFTAQVFLTEGALPQRAQDIALEKTRQFFDPLQGGSDGKGWQFGRNVYLSEIYELLEQVPGIDHIRNITLRDDASLTNIALDDHQLVTVDLPRIRFELNERLGNTWQPLDDSL